MTCAVGTSGADDRPIVEIRDGGLEPTVLVVHVGEIVRWQPPPGESVRIELDGHPTAHEVAERAAELLAIFRKPGDHSYVLTLSSTGRRLRGTVSVREARGPWEQAVDCGEGSSDRICFMR